MLRMRGGRMGGGDRMVAQQLLEDAHIVHIEVLNSESIVVAFSNGAAARLDMEKVKELALRCASEIVPYQAEPD